MKRVMMCSIVNTGTRTLRGVLQEAGYTVRHHHLPDPFWDKCEIAPVRDPAMHCISSFNRGVQCRITDYNLLARSGIPAVPVDLPDHRDAALSYILGEDISADWTPVGATPDVWGLRAKYERDGVFPFAHRLRDDTKAWLQNLGYDMEWLDGS